MQTAETEHRACPDCGATVPVHHGYVTWCDRCGWNLHPSAPELPKNLFERIYASLGQRRSQALADRLVQAAVPKPALSVPTLCAFALSTFVHGMTLAFAAGGAAVLIRGWPRFSAIAGGLALFLIAAAVRPRFARLPGDMLSRTGFPALYALVDRVATSLGSRRVSGIVVDLSFNAVLEQTGWGGKTVLHLGLPLWSILDDQERVALVAHELGHSVNGDPRRGVYVATAIDSLGNWYAMLRPEAVFPPDKGVFVAMAMAPFNLIMLGLAALARLGAYALCRLLWFDSQRAEYLADYVGAAAGGTDAMLCLLRKLHFRLTVDLALRRAVRGSRIEGNVSRALDQVIRDVPEREIMRIDRIQRLARSRLDVVHPPTADRIRFLQAHRTPWPNVTVPLADAARLDGELDALQRTMQHKLAP